MKIIIIYSTFPNLKEAKKIAKHLLMKKLIVCANFFSIESMYWWQGKIEDSKEIVSLLKTKEKNWPEIKAEIKKLHSYKVPCVIKIHAEANNEYWEWLKTQTK